MKTPAMPTSPEGWNRLAAALVRSRLAYADMNHQELSVALAGMGVVQEPKNISGKLRAGTFSASFFLQCLVACGAQTIDLPAIEKNGS